MQETMYQVELLQEDKYRLFKGVYADFVSKAVSDYRFELFYYLHHYFLVNMIYYPALVLLGV